MRSFLVMAGWLHPEEKIGICEIENARGKEVISFCYDPKWLRDHPDITLDPDLYAMVGRQYPSSDKPSFGFLSDTAPDRWGRTLMQHREKQDAKDEKRQVRTLMESDYILGVHDAGRVGGIRFADKNGYLSDRDTLAAPPMEKLRELEAASQMLESGDPDIRKWLKNLLEPGSSLGGARPKANVIDEHGCMWIAKFPSVNDEVDIGAWEAVAQSLAKKCGIRVPETRTIRLSKSGTTFLSKRFDRNEMARIHYASAMTMLGKTDGDDAGYLDIVDIIERITGDTDKELKELWMRMALNVCISNTDDHLRNHGFLLEGSNWHMSPAFDLNPDVEKQHMDLQILDSNEKDLNAVLEAAEYFRLDGNESRELLNGIKSTVRDNWKEEAERFGIPAKEQNVMHEAFEQAYVR